MRALIANRKTLYVERQMSKWSDELLQVDHRFTARSVHNSTLVTGKQWIFATVKVCYGNVQFISDAEIVKKEGLFGMFLPPKSIVRIQFQKCIVESQGFLSSSDIPNAFLRGACVFPIENEQLPKTSQDVEQLLAVSKEVQAIGTKGKNSLARRTKEILDSDENTFYESLSISQLAPKLKISRETLSRNFTQAYGLSPLQYRLHSRIMNAVMMLAKGEAILNVAFDVGFRDLSRFYKQFGRIAASTPKAYRF